MKGIKKNYSSEQITLESTTKFPNSKLPVLLYRNVLELPSFFRALFIKKLFKSNGWSNSWKSGIYTYHHYHSNTHEVLGVYKGKTTLLLGGKKGVKIKISKGDVIIIPVGVAHKNLGKETQIKCVGAYPYGKDYDMNYGKKKERPKTDENIKKVKVPRKDPVFGLIDGLHLYWK